MLEKETTRIKMMGGVESTLMTAREGVQSTSGRRRFWTTAVCLLGVEGDQVPTLLFLKWNFKDPTDEGHLLVSNIGMSAG